MKGEKFGVGEPSAFEDAAIMIRSLFRTDQSGQDLTHTTRDISENIEILPTSMVFWYFLFAEFQSGNPVI